MWALANSIVNWDFSDARNDVLQPGTDTDYMSIGVLLDIVEISPQLALHYVLCNSMMQLGADLSPLLQDQLLNAGLVKQIEQLRNFVAVAPL